MKSWNRRFFLPSILVCCVLISSAVLAQSNNPNTSVGDQKMIVAAEVLPVTTDRISRPGADILNSALTPTSEGESSEPEVGVIQADSIQTTEVQAHTDTSSEVASTVQAEVEGTDPEVEDETPEVKKVDKIEVKLVIQGPGISKSGKISVQKGSTVYQVMKQGSTDLDFSLKTSHHSSLGIFVEGIAGISNKPKSNLYWLYYVNGQFASRGVSLQTVQEGDTITWSYE